MTRSGSRQTSLTGRVGTRRTGLLPLWPHQWAWWCLWLVLSFQVDIYWKGLQQVGEMWIQGCACLLRRHGLSEGPALGEGPQRSHRALLGRLKSQLKGVESARQSWSFIVFQETHGLHVHIFTHKQFC